MKLLTIDLETHLIEQGNLVPRIVSACHKESDSDLVHLQIRQTHMKDFQFSLYQAMVDNLNQNNPSYLVGQNVSFDLGCLCAEEPAFLEIVFEYYERCLVLDTMVMGKLDAIHDGDLDIRRFSLDRLCKRYLSLNVGGKQGDDIWRTRYSELDCIPVKAWPKEAVEYAVNDVRYTELLAKHLLTLGTFTIQEASRQCYAAWALHLVSVYGMEIDSNEADRFIYKVNCDYEANMQLAKQEGFLRDNGTKNLAVLRQKISDAYNGKPPKTPKGSVKTDIETLKQSNDEVLIRYAEGRFAEKLKTTYAPILSNESVHPRYNVLVKSGRTSCSKPNMQNPPRQGGFRKCFRPRRGFVYALCDYDQIELLALGQIHMWMFGTSSLAKAVNEGRDLHIEVAAKLNPQDPKAYRQFAKVANYGFPGGLSAKVFKAYSKGFGLEITKEEAERIRLAWLQTWPEMSPYFERIGRDTAWMDAKVTQFKSGRIRGKCGFTQYANTLFQGLVADGAKYALSQVSKSCYTDQQSPLFNSRPVAFLHDEIIIETPEEGSHLAAAELEKIMVKCMQEWIPDVKVSAEAFTSKSWNKNASITIKDGIMVPWEASND